jgi:hypothetical protein
LTIVVSSTFMMMLAMTAKVMATMFVGVWAFGLLGAKGGPPFSQTGRNRPVPAGPTILRYRGWA